MMNGNIVIMSDEDGSRHWYLDGKRHRDDGPAIIRRNGSFHWYKNGLRHREDGPAIEYADGDRWWYFEGKLHREGGPAIEWAPGRTSWWIKGINYDEKLYEAALARYLFAEEKARKRRRPTEDAA